ncbi:MAG TPA: hypothetical protein VGR62_00560 [Candidatus Binatia bacterium]|jgi:hypothetical protein|nr:hypothetical protein [Candidatus Binatia bacterium]
MKRSHVFLVAIITAFLGTASAAFAHHIEGNVICDKDYDGNFDASDTKLANVTVRARSQDVDPGTDWTDNTDANGFYSIGLPGRTDRYSVRAINLQAGWTIVSPSGGFTIVQIITNTSQDHATVNFLIQGCSPPPTTTTTSSTTTTKPTTTTSTSSTTTTTRPTTTTTSSTTTTTKPSTTTSSSSTSTSTSSTSTSSSTTSTTFPGGCGCDGTPFLVESEGRFNNDGDLRGSIGANDPDGRIQFGKNVVMADGTKVTADSVTVGNLSNVDRVIANHVQSGVGAIIRNGTSLPSLPIVDPFCTIPSFVCGDEAVVVAVGDSTAPLPPGTYGRVRVLNGGKLRLAAGTFNFCDIKMGRGAIIEAQGPVVANVVGSVSIGTGSHVGPAGNNPPVHLNVAGHKLRVSQGAVAEAVIRAPFAKVTLGRDSLVQGCFCSESARTDKHITLICEE